MRIFVQNLLGRIGAMFLGLALCLSVNAQPTMGGGDVKPSASPSAVAGAADTASAAAKSAVAPAAASDASDQDLQRVIADFKLLKMLAYLAVGLAVLVGLVLYALRHRRIQKYDTLFAVIATTLLAPLLLYLATKTLSTDASACLGVALGGGADASVFSDVCRSSRESVANLFGFKSLWTLVSGRTVENGVALALPAGLVTALIYLSATLIAPLILLLLKPLVKASLSRK